MLCLFYTFYVFLFYISLWVCRLGVSTEMLIILWINKHNFETKLSYLSGFYLRYTDILYTYNWHLWFSSHICVKGVMGLVSVHKGFR